EEGHVSQVQETREANDDVETERERGEDPDLRDDLEIVAVDGPEDGNQDRERHPAEERLPSDGDAREVEEQDRRLEENEQHDGARRIRHAECGEGQQEAHYQRRGQGSVEHALRGSCCGSEHQARSRTTSPRRPLGRKIRIRIKIENAKMSLYSAP